MTENVWVVGTVTDEEYKQFMELTLLLLGSSSERVTEWESYHESMLAQARMVLLWESIRRRLGVPYNEDCVPLAVHSETMELAVTTRKNASMMTKDGTMHEALKGIREGRLL